MRRRKKRIIKKNYNILIFVACFGFYKNFIYINLFLDCFLCCSVLFFFCFIIISIILVMRFLVDWNVISNRKLREIYEREIEEQKIIIILWLYYCIIYYFLLSVEKWMREKQDEKCINLILSEKLKRNSKKLYWITWSFFFYQISTVLLRNWLMLEVK